MVIILEKKIDMSKYKKSLKNLEHILSLLETIEHREDERDMIIDSFIHMKSSKITESKIIGKLRYLRRKRDRDYWQKRLGIKFNGSLKMEFYRNFHFDFGEDRGVTKELLVESEPIDESIFESGDGEIFEYLNSIRDIAIKNRREEIDKFIEYATSNPHLTIDDIYSIILATLPSERLFRTPIPYPTLSRVIGSDYRLSVGSRNISISKGFTYRLYGRDLNYIVTAVYERESIYRKIWEHKSLNIGRSIGSIRDNFEDDFKSAIDRLERELFELYGDMETIREHIFKYVENYVNSSSSLTLSEKLRRRIRYHFQEELRDVKSRKQKEELLAKSIRDFKSLFPLARALKREIIFHVGPTNSGKTYSALEELKRGDSGYYLAPLRLLALEGYENLIDGGLNASLITGEEEIIDEESTHIASTVEMMNSDVEVDVAVIDEVQMVSDRDRGWAWVNAIIGVPAKKVILTGSPDALDVIRELSKYLNEPLKVVEFKRKNRLQLLSKPTKLKRLTKKTAIVAFSRRDVLNLKGQLSKRYRVSVIYGNLSPEVRREEARRFREGESDILIATDAISMGLNLPIETLLFAQHSKFDGFKTRELNQSEVTQIAGRAGRFGLNEVGYIGALDRDTLKVISSKMRAKPKSIKLPLSVMATLEHTLLIGDILKIDDIYKILQFFAENMEFEGPFRTANISSMLEIASIVSKYDIDLKRKYFLSCSPAPISSPYIEAIFHSYLKRLEMGLPVEYNPPRELPKYAKTNLELLKAEDRVREITLYLWLSFKFPDSFPDKSLALQTRGRLNQFIEESLKIGSFVRRCSRCSRVLNFKSNFSICDRCFYKMKRGF